MKRVAVFGIGSTNFRFTVATTDGEWCTDLTVEATRPSELSSQLVEAIERLQTATSDEIDAVGIACTGLVDSTTGVIHDLDTPASETIARVDVATAIREAHGLPVAIANDCTASALGEWHYGARDGHTSLAHVTFGTGIGSGIVEGGRLLRGEAGQAGEVGLLPVAPNSDLSSTGVKGAWEAICSGRGIPTYVATKASQRDRTDEIPAKLASDHDLTAEAVFEMADAGNSFAQDCLDDVANYNAAGLAMVCNAVNPGLVTLGGGVGLNNQDWLLEGINRYLDDYQFVNRPDIQMTTLGDDIGLYGALALVRAGHAEHPPAASATMDHAMD